MISVIEDIGVSKPSDLVQTALEALLLKILALPGLLADAPRTLELEGPTADW